ncbi:MAG: LacI family DNA-binding transcriptional regulator [Lentisphaerota bacterium]
MNKKRLTMKEIARLANTSRSTVSRVISDSPRISDEVKKRVRAIIEQTGFRPNISAQSLRGSSTGQIVILLNRLSHGVLPNMAQGVDDVIRAHNLHTLCCFAHGPKDYIKLWQRYARSGEVYGVILIAPPLSLLAEPYAVNECPAVLCACHPGNNRKGWRKADSVSMNNRKAINDLLARLVEKNCKSIAFLASQSDVYDNANRCQAFLDFLATKTTITGQIVRSPETYQDTRALIAKWFDSGNNLPDAFVCFSDDIALAVFDSLHEKNIKVPRDVALTGFDDILLAQFLGISTVRVPSFEMGQEAAKLLLSRIHSDSPAPAVRNSIFELENRFRNSSEFGQPGPGI